MAASKKKNSLVNNINKRKKAGKSRPKSKSKVSKESYSEMQKGWPHSAKKKAAKKGAAKKGAAKKGAAKKGAAKKTSAARKGGAKTAKRSSGKKTARKSAKSS